MLEGRAQAALARRHIARGRGQKVEVALDLGGDLGAAQHAHPGRGQLDAQRDALHRLADAHHGRIGCTVQGKGRIRAPRSLVEEQHRAGAVPFRRQRRGAIRRRHGHAQPVHVQHPLARQPQPLARGSQHAHICAPLHHVADDPHALQQMFQVVQDEQQGAAVQIGGELGDRLLGGAQAQPQRAGHRRADGLRLAHRGQRDKADAVAKPRGQPFRGRNRQPRLADAARPGEREQPAIGARQHLANALDLGGAADERRGWCGQRARRRSGRRAVVRRMAVVGGWRRRAGQRIHRGQPLVAQLAPRHLEKGRAVGGGNLQRLGQQLGHLARGAPLVGLDLADRRERAADAIGQRVLRQVERAPPLPYPGAKGDRLCHEMPIRRICRKPHVSIPQYSATAHGRQRSRHWPMGIERG